MSAERGALPAGTPGGDGAAGGREKSTHAFINLTCRRAEGIPFTVKCFDESGSEVVYIERQGEKYAVRVYDTYTYIKDLQSAQFAKILSKHNINPHELVRQILQMRASAYSRRRVARVVMREFNALRDFIPNYGAVLSVRYLDERIMLQTAVAVYRNGRLMLFDEDEVVHDEENDAVYIPRGSARGIAHMLPELNLLRAAVEYLKSEKNAVPQLVMEVADVLRRHVTLASKQYYTAAAVYVVATYFTPLFKYMPVLRIGKAGFNVGGTTLLKTLCSLSAFPLMLADVSDASNYILAHHMRATLCIDEVKREVGEERLRRLSLFIDAGFDRDIKIPRMLDGGRAPMLYSVFGARIIVDPQSLLTNYSNARRQLVLLTFHDRNRRELISVDEMREMYAELIHKLYAAFLLYADDVYRRYSNLREMFPDLRGDVLQAYGALLAIASYDNEILNDVMQVIYESAEFASALKIEADIVKHILKLVYDELYDYAEKYCASELDPAEGLQIKIEDLRRKIRESVMELVQVDINISRSDNRREWQRIKDDYDRLLQRHTFAAVVRQYLQRFVTRDARRHLIIKLDAVNELYDAMRMLAAAIGIEFEPACPLESIMKLDDIRKCAAEVADRSGEDFESVFKTLQQDYRLRVEYCAKQRVAEEKREAPGAGGEAEEAGKPEAAAAEPREEKEPPPAVAGQCPDGYVYDDVTKRCYKIWL